MQAQPVRLTLRLQSSPLLCIDAAKKVMSQKRACPSGAEKGKRKEERKEKKTNKTDNGCVRFTVGVQIRLG